MAKRVSICVKMADLRDSAHDARVAETRERQSAETKEMLAGDAKQLARSSRLSGEMAKA